MGKKSFFLLALLILVAVGGGLFFLTWDIPPPTVQVEKVIPDDRLPK